MNAGYRCAGCAGTTASAVHRATEMMFGLGGSFDYAECARCETLQLLSPPSDLGRFYPADRYYSFADPGTSTAMHRFLRRGRTMLLLRVGPRMQFMYRGRRLPTWYSWFASRGIGLHSAILDVGSGRGSLLVQLARDGFRNVTGIDAFIDSDICPASAVRVLKGTVADLEGSFDVIMLHHSIEHMHDPVLQLEMLRARLRRGGVMIVRTPLAGTTSWHEYGVNWVQLDPPRHLVVFSEQGFGLAAERAGLVVTEVVHDSTGFQFWGSEQIKRGRPLMPAGPGDGGGGFRLFTSAEMDEYERRARELNMRGEGDQAIFFLAVA